MLPLICTGSALTSGCPLPFSDSLDGDGTESRKYRYQARQGTGVTLDCRRQFGNLAIIATCVYVAHLSLHRSLFIFERTTAASLLLTGPFIFYDGLQCYLLFWALANNRMYMYLYGFLLTNDTWTGGGETAHGQLSKRKN